MKQRFIRTVIIENLEVKMVNDVIAPWPMTNSYVDNDNLKRLFVSSFPAATATVENDNAMESRNLIKDRYNFSLRAPYR